MKLADDNTRSDKCNSRLDQHSANLDANPAHSEVVCASGSAKLPWGLKNDTLCPGSMRTITKQKIKAFQLGTMEVVTKKLSRRELEDHKRKEEELAAQEVYKDFVASFEESQQSGKLFVKGMEIVPGEGIDRQVPDKGRPYKSASKLQELASTFSSFKATRDSGHQSKRHSSDAVSSGEHKRSSTSSSKSTHSKPHRSSEKRKTNLEVFKDELKRIQEERGRRHELKMKVQEQDDKSRRSRFEPYVPATDSVIESDLSLDKASLDKNTLEDRETTNLFISNLSRSLYEAEIMELFGCFGPLASVKIMYPRSEEERSRGSNCGFVAFMARDDATKALEQLDGHEFGGLALRISWGKPIHIPAQPVYVKPFTTDQHADGSKRTGYPFNATPPPGFPELSKQSADQVSPQKLSNLINGTVVKVNMPTNKQLLCLIHRTIEFVIREGPKFECALIEKEKSNPMFRFLSENDLASHVYYRWKLYSILQGDSVYHWSESHFKMFEPGSIWIPPAVATGKHNMVSTYDESFERAKAESEEQEDHRQLHWKCQKFSEMLKHLTVDRDLIADSMVYAIERAHLAEDISKAICATLASHETKAPQKAALLFLISDILHNCSFGVSNSSSYRKAFEELLPSAFECLCECCATLGGRVKTEQFKSKVMACFRAWEDWAVYPSDTLIQLQNIFLGLLSSKSGSVQQEVAEAARDDVADEGQAGRRSGQANEGDIDGVPMNESDGVAFDGDASATAVDGTDVDIDGEPLDASDAGIDNAHKDKGFFVKSKWSKVNPDQSARIGIAAAEVVKKRSRTRASRERTHSSRRSSRTAHKHRKKERHKQSHSASDS